MSRRLQILRVLFARDGGASLDTLFCLLAAPDKDPIEGVRSIPAENRALAHEYLLEIAVNRDIDSTLRALEAQ
jgi:hypothetical protein